MLVIILYPKNQKKSRGFGKNVKNSETDNPNRDICRHNLGGTVSDKYIQAGILKMEKETRRRIDRRIIYHIVSAAVLAGSLLFSVFYFRAVFFRTVQAFKDFGLSVAYYFTELLGVEGVITPTVGAIPNETTLPGKKTVTARSMEMRTYIPAPWGGGRRPQSWRAAGNGAGQRHAGGEAKIKPRRAVSLEEFRVCRGILHGPDFGKKFRF